MKRAYDHAVRVPRSLVTLVLLVLLLTAPRVAAAALMYHGDLTSLALSAEVIVRARPIAARKADEYTTVRTLKVTRSFKGDLAPGATFETTYDDLYSFGEVEDRFPDGGLKRKVGDEVVLFLQRPKKPREKDGHVFVVLSSGLRIFLDGKAYRFEQWNNPGGFTAVPQGHDPFDIFGDPRGGDPLDLAGLDEEIEGALARAAVIRAALDEPDGPARRRRLVDLSGAAAEEDRPANSAIGGAYASTAATAIVEALASTGDLDAFLEALSRTDGVATSYVRMPFTIPTLLAAAADRKRPVSSRVAALRLVAGRVFELRDTPGAEARFLPLLADPSPDVRIAAVALRSSESPSKAMKTALLNRWKVERDDRVLIAIAEAAIAMQLRWELDDLPGRIPIVAVERRRDVIRIGWAEPADGVNFAVREARLAVRRDGSPERVVDLWAHPAHYSTGSVAEATSRIVIEPPMTPGEATLELSVVLTDHAKHRPNVSRVFPLGTMNVTPDMIRPARTRIDVLPSTSAAADAGNAPSPTTTARRSACGCELLPDHGSPELWMLAVFSALVLERRRRRTA